MGTPIRHRWAKAGHREVAEACSESLIGGVEPLFAEKPLQREFLLAIPTKIALWRGQMILRLIAELTQPPPAPL